LGGDEEVVVVGVVGEYFGLDAGWTVEVVAGEGGYEFGVEALELLPGLGGVHAVVVILYLTNMLNYVLICNCRDVQIKAD
jgi:hypothetical protein